MRTFWISIIFTGISLIHSNVHAQFLEKRTADSLKTVISDHAIAPEQRIKSLSQLAEYYFSVNDSTQQKLFLEEALLQSENNHSSEGKIYALAAALKTEENDVEQIYSLMEQLHSEIDRTFNLQIKAFALLRMGEKKIYVSDNQGIDDIFNAIDLLQHGNENTEKYKLLFNCYTILCKNNAAGDHVQEKEYIDMAINCANRTHDIEIICQAKTLQSIYIAQQYMRNRDRTALLDSAFVIEHEIYDLTTRYPDYISQKTFVVNRIALAERYELFKNDIEKTEKYAAEALPLVESSSDFNSKVRAIAIKYFIYMAKDNYAAAEAEVLKCIEMHEKEVYSKPKANYRYQNTYSALYGLLGRFYKQTGQWEKAVAAVDKSFSIYKQYETNKAIEFEKMTQVKYGLIEKEKEIKGYHKLITLYIVIAIIVALFLFFAILYFVNRYKYMLKSKNAAENEVRMKALESEMRRKEAMLNSLILERKEKLVKKIERTVKNSSDNNTGKIENLLKKEHLHERERNKFITLFQNIHPEFYSKLRQQAGKNTLSDYDLKYAGYLSLGMTNHEIAQELNVTSETVKVQKSKLKSKLNLDRDVELKAWLMSMNVLN
jgi:DNA-binding CsgD family transcriptional regulator